MKRYIFYGIGNHLWLRLGERKELLDYIYGFMDSSPKNWGKEYFGIEVLPPHKLEKLDFEKIIITTPIYYKEIKKDLVEKWSVNEEKIQFLDDFIAERILHADFLPEAIALEACTNCQLNCRSCYMRKNNFGALKNGYLKYKDFKELVDLNPQLKTIELSNNGEMFLNPELKRIIEYAYLKGIQLTAWNGVNLNNVSDDLLETLVLCKFKGITVSIDGTNQETYAQYRQNGNYDKVIQNIRKINRLKYLHNTQYPELRWQFVVMNHNEKETVEAKFLANELNMEIRFKQTWDQGFVPLFPEMLLRVTGIDFTRNKSTNEHYDTVIYGNELCRQLFLCPRINWDGRLLGCCAYYMDDFGVNVFEVGLKRALQNSKYLTAKKMLMGLCMGDFDTTNLPCAKCTYYRSIKENNNYIKTSHLFEKLID